MDSKYSIHIRYEKSYGIILESTISQNKYAYNSLGIHIHKLFHVNNTFQIDLHVLW